MVGDKPLEKNSALPQLDFLAVFVGAPVDRTDQRHRTPRFGATNERRTTFFDRCHDIFNGAPERPTPKRKFLAAPSRAHPGKEIDETGLRAPIS